MKDLKVRRGTLIKGLFYLFVPFQLFFSPLNAQLTGYGYTRTITIQADQVSGTLSNFPVLISIRNNSLRTVGYGGRVRNNNGYDIVFSLGNCSSTLPHQIERYVPSTGEYVAWVNVPSLSSAANTTLIMFYGNSSISANPSTDDVWDNNYLGVWHFNNSVNDNSGNSRNLTNVNTTNFNNSKIGLGRRLNTEEVNSDDNDCRYLQLPSNMFNGVNNFTFEGWVYLDANTTSWERVFDFGRNTDINMFLTPSIEDNSNGVKRFAITTGGNGSEQRISSTTGTTTGRWHHFALTINHSNNRGSLYYDGVLSATNNSMTLRPSNITPNNSNYFGRSHYDNDHGLYGKIDEFRVSNTARSADWVATSFNNQNDPDEFYSLSTELSTNSLCGALPVTLIAFDGEAHSNGANTISWITAQEKDNAQFILERSANGTQWEELKTITVDNPDSDIKRSYSVEDKNPLLPVSHYRLKQVDLYGRLTVYHIITLKQSRGSDDHFIVRPNPACNRVFVELDESLRPQDAKIQLMNSNGLPMPVKASFTGNTITLDMPGITNGVYFLHIYKKGQQYSRKLLIVQ